MEGRKEKIIERTLDHLNKHSMLNLEVKIKCIELLASFIYKGYFSLVKSISKLTLKQELVHLMLNQMNNSYELAESSYSDIKIRKKIHQSQKRMLLSNEEFERLINFK